MMHGKDSLQDIQVIAPNFKRRLSGVTATIVRLLPHQAKEIRIVSTGPGLPDTLPHIPFWKVLFLNKTWRVWHARRNTEMLAGLILKYVFFKKLRLLFTSASQRHHTRYSKFLIRQMDAVIATSEKTRRYLERPAQVVLHGIDTETFTPIDDKRALRQNVGLSPKGIVIGCYGRLRNQKGSDVFVDAMLEILRENPAISAILMGRATPKHQNFADRLRHKIEQSNLSDRLHILPEAPVDDMVKWYQILDIYIAPQRWEGFGLTPLEAMSCGVPVIATDVGAFPELIEDGKTGHIIPAGNVAAMAGAVRSLLSETGKIAQDSIYARKHVLKKFRLQQEAKALNQIYKTLLSEKI